MAVQKSKRFFQSIRGRFIVFFLIGTLMTLSFVAVISYQTINHTVSNNNTKIASAEFAQISGNITHLYQNIDRQIVDLANSSCITTLVAHDRHTPLTIAYALQDLKSVSSQLISNFPYVQSVVLLYDDGSHIVATQDSFRLSFSEDAKNATSEAVWSVLPTIWFQTTIRGGVTSKDFPEYIHTPSTNLLSFMRKIKHGTLIVNVKEEYVEKLYAGITENTSYNIRILDSNGKIISSLNKKELGNLYAYFDEMSSYRTENASVNSFSVEGYQILWRYMDNYSLFVTNEIYLVEYMKSVNYIRNMVVLMFVIGMALTCSAFFLWIRKVFSPMKQLECSMAKAGLGDYHRIDILPSQYDEISMIVRNYNLMLDQLAALDRSKRTAEEQYRTSELKALRSQLNPHFLYNTLNVLKWMAIEHNEPQIADGISSLGTIIAPLYKTDLPEHSILEELKLLNKYVSIMNLRFGGKVTMTTAIPPSLEYALLPRFCMQPIIENSFIHGFAAQGYHGNILISAVEDAANDVWITITDNGIGLAPERIEKINQRLFTLDVLESVGLYNTCARLRLRYGTKYGLTLFSNANGQGLCVKLHLPLQTRNVQRSASAF